MIYVQLIISLFYSISYPTLPILLSIVHSQRCHVAPFLNKGNLMRLKIELNLDDLCLRVGPHWL